MGQTHTSLFMLFWPTYVYIDLKIYLFLLILKKFLILACFKFGYDQIYGYSQAYASTYKINIFMIEQPFLQVLSFCHDSRVLGVDILLTIFAEMNVNTHAYYSHTHLKIFRNYRGYGWVCPTPLLLNCVLTVIYLTYSGYFQSLLELVMYSVTWHTL